MIQFINNENVKLFVHKSINNISTHKLTAVTKLHE